MNNKKGNVSFPAKLLKPIGRFLEEEIKKLTKTKKSIENDDPFLDIDRDKQNSVEAEVDEQVGRLHSEVKSKFINRQIVQMRRALSRVRKGNYGICEVCGKMIDTDRLAIKPDATVCVKCEKAKE